MLATARPMLHIPWGDARMCSLADLYFKGDHGGMLRYLEWFFEGAALEGKDVLDIGGGSGWLSLYCSLRGARSVTLVEPFGAGSSNTMLEQFSEGVRRLGASNVSLINAPFPCREINRTFDVVVLHNSINHLAESDVVRLRTSSASRETYRRLCAEVRRLARPGADLLIADCSNRNVFADLRLPHPISRSICWTKHQSPQTWLPLLEESGFSRVAVGWSAYRRLGRLGWLLTANALAAYALTSHFRLHLKAE